MPNPSNIFGWLPGGIKRPELNYEQLWQSFIHRTAEQIDHEAKVYITGQYSKVDAGWVERHYEQEQQRINEGGEV